MKTFLFLLILTFNSVIYAQIFNVGDLIIDKDTVGFSGGIELNLSITKNTKDILTFNNYGFVEYKHHKNTISFTNSINLKRTDGEDLINNATYLIRYYYQANKTLYLESFVQGFHDNIRYLDQRILVGGGTRFQVIKSDTRNFSLGSYLMYVYEHEDIPTDGLPSFYHNDIRFVGYFSFVYQVKDNITVSLSGYYEPRVDRIEDYMFDGFGRVTFKIFKNLNFNVSYQLNLDSQPPGDIPDTQYQLLNGVSYTF